MSRTPYLINSNARPRSQKPGPQGSFCIFFSAQSIDSFIEGLEAGSFSFLQSGLLVFGNLSLSLITLS